MSRKARTCFVERMRCVSGSIPPSATGGLSGAEGRIGGYVAAILQKGQVGDGCGGIVYGEVDNYLYIAYLYRHL